ncbi:MAG: DUF559 domain-containing protein [Rothia sp. (in: high G+C Gram-positive bacteria)]|nr:DUF559 domain-containing protein [Rothia sp. (in: high G+C Gram-positive bacteria)]
MNQDFMENILTLSELIDRGFTFENVQRGVREGSLLKMAHGIYMLSSFNQKLTRFDRPKANLVARAKPLRRPILSHESAALWLGAPLLAPPTAVHISTTSASGRSRPGLKLHRNRAQQCESATLVDGFLTTSPAQTVNDCVDTTSVGGALAIAHYFLHQRSCTREEITEALGKPRYAQQGRAVKVAQRLTALCESPLESLAWNLFHEWAIELPEQQVEFGFAGGRRHRVDFLWRHQRLILEVDGQQKYGGEWGNPQEVIRNERARQRDLEKLGWAVLRADWGDVVRNPRHLRLRLSEFGL